MLIKHYFGERKQEQTALAGPHPRLKPRKGLRHGEVSGRGRSKRVGNAKAASGDPGLLAHAMAEAVQPVPVIDSSRLKLVPRCDSGYSGFQGLRTRPQMLDDALVLAGTG